MPAGTKHDFSLLYFASIEKKKQIYKLKLYRIDSFK